MTPESKKELDDGWGSTDRTALYELACALKAFVEGRANPMEIRLMIFCGLLMQNRKAVHPVVIRETVKTTDVIARKVFKKDPERILGGQTLRFWKEMLASPKSRSK